MSALYNLIEERGCGIEYTIASDSSLQYLDCIAEENMIDPSLVNGNSDHYTYRIEDSEDNDVVARYTEVGVERTFLPLSQEEIDKIWDEAMGSNNGYEQT